ncbi:MAG: hypothetical protein H0X25_07430 [Acidobacteriales bacterium]|nr:hypothetical protein [Terriglobales bacterium]
MQSHTRSTLISIAFLILAAASNSAAQTFTTLHNFNGADGDFPVSPVLQAPDGTLYGTTRGGGDGYGTVFALSPSGSLTTLHSFHISDGADPSTGLTLGPDGSFYGATAEGASGHFCDSPYIVCGTIFKVTPGGVLTTLHRFHRTDGDSVASNLVLGRDGNFYGTTPGGGANYSCDGGTSCGTVFTMTPDGTITTLHNFNNRDGAHPAAGLILASDGNFYGTTNLGGAYDNGVVYEITSAGQFKLLHSFLLEEGATLIAGVVQGRDGNLYGAAENGGTGNCTSAGCGTIYRITPSGDVTVLHAFEYTDGGLPQNLAVGVDGNFYGTTLDGGANTDCFAYYVCGTVFEITPSGVLTTLHNFDNATGFTAFAQLVQAKNGALYGSTAQGGLYYGGTLFRQELP